MRVKPPVAPGEPLPVEVLERDHEPVMVGGERVEQVVNFWVVQNGWWTQQPINRRYWELLTVRGRRLVVFFDLETEGWSTQAA